MLTLFNSSWRCILIPKEVSWGYATMISIVSGLISFFIFFFVEIIRGDILKDTLNAEYQAEQYFNLNIIIWTGLLAIFGISFLTNVFVFRKYAFEPKVVSSVLAGVLTSLILFLISWVSIVSVYSEEYSQLDIWTQLRLSVQFYSLFSIYILPYPTLFWFLALLIYHIILTIFVGLFFYEKRKKSNKKKEDE